MARPDPRFITFPVFPGSPFLALVRSPSSSISFVVDVLFPVASRVVVHPLIDQGCEVCLAK
jgi:methionine salvage enolase-phosphatase E1